MKRKLKNQELTMAAKGIEAKKGEKEWLEYQIEYHDLMLKSGLEMNHRKNIRDFKNKRREHMEELETVKQIIKILHDQIRNGVEIREEKDTEEIVGQEGTDKKGKEIKQKTGDK